MNRILMLACLVAPIGMVCATPSVTVTQTTQDVSSREVTIAYTLAGDPAVITVNVQTNAGDDVWVPIGDEHLVSFAGDVNKVVGTGNRTIKWRPDKAWPGQNITDGSLRIGVTAWATNAPPDYMAVSLISPKTIFYYVSDRAVPGGVTNDMYKSEYMLLRRIPAANVAWRMGSPEDEPGRKPARETPHVVTLTNDFYLGVYPVTQRQYEIVVGTNPSFFRVAYPYGPVEQVSWYQIRGAAGGDWDWPTNGHSVDPTGFPGVMSAVSGVFGFDLPTEAQWEFACRAGSGAALYNEMAVTSANLNLIACYGGNSQEYLQHYRRTEPVGSYLPNAWGLYDMIGNVWEWTLDWYQESTEGLDPEIGAATGEKKVARGGCAGNASQFCRCAYRDPNSPSANDTGIGFRICLNLP